MTMPYIPFVPRDPTGNPDDYALCRAITVSDLANVARLSPQELWKALESDVSLVVLLRSYLLLAPRFFEPDYDHEACSLLLDVLLKLYACGVR